VADHAGLRAVTLSLAATAFAAFVLSLFCRTERLDARPVVER
jgi:hypothetical protein